MKISSVQSTNFGGIIQEIQPNAKTTAENLIKKTESFLLPATLSSTIATAMSVMCGEEDNIDRRLSEQGIKAVSAIEDDICILTKHGNSFRIKPTLSMADDRAKMFVTCEMNNDISYYGILPYFKFIENTTRRDIVRKGLKIHSNELKYVNDNMKEKLAKGLSKQIRKRVNKSDLFCIGPSVYYSNKPTNTVYSVRLTESELTPKDISTCKFITDKNGVYTGYELTAYDLTRGNLVTKKYIEQQKPSYKLPDIIDTTIKADYAQACRFGNGELGFRYLDTAKSIISQLKKGGIKNAKTDDLNVVKYLKDDGRTGTFFTYFSTQSGRAIVFNKEAEYVTQMEFIKNEDGDIIDCYRLK